jgi:hypothetical protein
MYAEYNRRWCGIVYFIGDRSSLPSRFGVGPRHAFRIPLPIMSKETTEDVGVRQDGYAVGTRRN